MQVRHGHAGSIPGLGRAPGEENGNPLQYSCLENPMDRGAWRAIVHWVAQNRNWLKWPSTAWCVYLMTKQKLLQLGWEVLIHSQYWLNIVPSGFHLFWSLQNSLNGKNFNSLRTVKATQNSSLLKKIRFREDRIMKLLEEWQKVVEQNGEYIIQWSSFWKGKMPFIFT